MPLEICEEMACAKKLSLSAKTRQTILFRIKNSSGREVCGFLVKGKRGNQRFEPVRNVANTPGSFIVLEKDILKLRSRAYEQGCSIQAFIHSHIGKVSLSYEDEVDFQNCAIPWIIVSANVTDLDYQVHYPNMPRKT